MLPRPTRTEESALRLAGYQVVAGVDEVGMGCLAGPVVAGAVIMAPATRIPGVRDSKTLSARQREELAGRIARKAVAWAVGEASVEEIGRLNILAASRLAMARALQALGTQVDFVLVDGNPIRSFAWPHKAIVDGDKKSFCIAAASIVAKVHRDRLLAGLEAVHPGYGLARHKGYGTAAHLAALRELGPCAAHRMTYAPVRQALATMVARAAV
jgi:ribonuclease HII